MRLAGQVCRGRPDQTRARGEALGVPGQREQRRRRMRSRRISKRLARPGGQIAVANQEGESLLRASAPRYLFALLISSARSK